MRPAIADMQKNDAVVVSPDIIPDARSVSMEIVWELAAKLGVDPVEVKPLAASIDVDALETIVATSDDASVTFDHASCTVEVTTVGPDISVFVTRNGRHKG